MSNRQGVTYDADNLVTLTPGSLSFNGTTYDVAASGSAAQALLIANAAAAAAAAAQATANAALPKAGGTMTGDINMSGTQKVTSMALPTAPGDATNKQYVDNLVTGVLRFKGSTDCSTNPNYPAAALGDAYVVSVAGKIGGAAGVVVEAGDVYFATAANLGGTQAAVGSSWDVVQYNLTGVLLSANNLSDVQSAATSRTNLGLGSAATYADTAFAKTANNLSDLANASTARTNLGLGTAATYADTAFAKTANNLSDLASAATARTNLGLGTAATYADTAFAKTANNLSDLASAATARTNLGLGTAATYAATAFAQTANNLSDLANAGTARTNLGLGTAATQNSTAFATAAQGTLASTAVQRAGDTMTGSLTLSTGANLLLTGGASSGAGNIRFGAAASASYDSNLLYLDATDKTLGFLAGSTPAFVAANGPYFGARGNTFTATANQRGQIFFMAGSPTSPNAYEGSISLGTNSTIRVFLTKEGRVTLNDTTTLYDANLAIGGSTSATSVQPAALRVSTNLTPTVGGDGYASWITPTFTKQATGTHSYLVGILLDTPVVSGGAATVTTTANIFVIGASTAGTQNYAILVNGGVVRFDGKLSLGLAATSTTAKLHIAGGSATAGTAPLKLTAGTNLTTPEAGALEYNNTLSFTDSTAVRKDVALKTTYTPTLTPAAVGAAGFSTQTFTVTGLTTNDTVLVNGPAATANSALVSFRVSAADTLSLTWFCQGALTPASGTYRIVAFRS